jgi:cbb3-type cytochrome oxidase cytochrome c subunit
MFGFKSMVSKFAFWSVVLLILVVVTAVRSQWSDPLGKTRDFTYWQNQYKQAAATLASDPAVKQAALDTPIAVNQVTVLQFPLLQADGSTQQRVDRCQSCHAGLGNPSMTAENLISVLDHRTVKTEDLAAYLSDPAHAETLSAIKTLGAHPGIRLESGDSPHDLGVIHGAKFSYGIATNASVTDGDKADYQYQKINLKQHPFPTFGCTTCHYGTGRELIQNSAHGNPEHSLTPMLPAKYMEAACAQCHAQYDAKTFKISYQAPLSSSRIIKLLDGADVGADGVQAYLNDPAHAATAQTVQYVAGQPQMQTIARGEGLFQAQACYGCHKIEGFSKGNVGPELTNEGRVAGGTTKIAHQLWDPRYQVASCVMPYFFAARKTNSDLPPGGVVGNPNAAIETVDPRSTKVTPAPVTVEGSPDYNEDVATSLRGRGYIADAARQGDVDALVTFVASQTGQNYSSSQASRFTTVAAYNISRPADVEVSAVVGKQLFEQSGCYACHYIGNPDKAHITGDPDFGKGGVAGPELSWEGTRHSQKWLIEHYKNPQAFVPGSIMPIFPFSNSQRAALSAYDASLRPSKASARPVSPDQDLPAGYVDQP